MDEQAKKTGQKIWHAGNRGEYMIQTPYGVYYADGYCEETNTVYEYYGDYWHGNPWIYNPQEMNPDAGKTFGQLFYETCQREAIILRLGYKLVTIWEANYQPGKI
jgi:hypothetical protein